MADIKNNPVQFHYGSLAKYNSLEDSSIKKSDIYFVVADGEADSSALDRGFLYVNGHAFGAGVMNVSVSEVVDSSFAFTVREYDPSTGEINVTTTTIPVSDVSAYEALVQRVESLEGDVSTLKDDVSTLKDDVSSLQADNASMKDDVSSLLSDMAKILGDPAYPEDASEGTPGYLHIIDQRIDEIDASVTNIYEEIYPTIERLETSVNTIETRVETIETSVNTIETRVETIETSVNTIIEHSVGELDTLAGFSYTDASDNVRTAVNIVELSQDPSTRDASLGVFIDGRFLNLAEVSVGESTKQVLTVNTAEIQAAVVDVPVYTMTKLETPSSSAYISTYRLTVTQAGSTSAAGVDIDIPKDFLVKSAEIKTVTVADEPYEGAQVGDKYIDFVINSRDASAGGEHLYLPVNDLVDTYSIASDSSEYLSINGQNEISFNADAVVDYVDSSLDITNHFSTLDGSVNDLEDAIDNIDSSITIINTSITEMKEQLVWQEI